MTKQPPGEASLFLQIDPVCDAFEASWKSDPPPRIEEYLGQVAPDHQAQLIQALCAIEIEQRLGRQERVSLAEYLQRFPTHQASLHTLAQEHPEWNLVAGDNVAEETVDTIASQEETNTRHRLESTQTAATVVTPRQTSPPPTDDFGDYELLEEIGQGGMGIIFRARQRKLNRIVAIKMIRSGQLASESDIRRFHSEAEAIGRLDHPQIVPIYEVDEENGIHFFSMAFVDGDDLSKKLHDGPLPPRQAAQIVREISLAIDYAHQQGIIHRDLKPANILLTEDGQIRVTDFGLAKHQNAQQGPTVTGDIVGTPGYMAPEQASGKRTEVGPSSDIYSLGAILYSLLTGRPPFQAATVVDTLLQVINDPPVPPQQLNPTVDRDLETICLKCLEKTGTRRYATAQELSLELKRFLDGRPIQARPVAALPRLWRWCCRRPRLAAAWATVALLLLFLGISGPMVAVQQARLKSDADQSAREARHSARQFQLAQQRANQEAATARKQRQRADDQAQLALSQKDVINEQASAAERNLYLARMNIAYSAWENANLRSTRRLLDIYRKPQPGKDYRGFEWHYLDELTHQERHVIKAHPRSTKSIDIHPDNLEMATLGIDGFMRIWNTQTGKLIRELKIETNGQRLLGPRSLDYSNDGRWLAVGCRDGEILLYDPETSKLVKKLKAGDGPLMKVVLSVDGSRCIASNGDGAIFVVQTGTGEASKVLKELSRQSARLKQRFSPGGMRYNPKPFAVSQDDKLLAFVDENKDIVIWDLEQEAEKSRVKRARFPSISPNFSILAFANNGKWIVHGDPRGEISVWQPPSVTALLKNWKHYQFIYDLLVSPDQRFLFSAGHDRTIRMKELAYEGRERIIRGHEAPVTCMALAKQGQFIVGGDTDGFVRTFSLQNHRNPLLLICPTGHFHDMAFHPKRQEHAFAQSDARIGIWEYINRHPNRLLTGHKRGAYSLAYHPSGEQMITGGGGGNLYLWNPATTDLLRTWQAHESKIYQVSFSPNGKLLASASLDHDLKIWEMDSGKLVQAIPLEKNISHRIMRITWNPEGTRVTPADYHGKAHTFDVQSGKQVLELPGTLATYTPDGKQIVSVEANSIVVSDATSGKRLGTMQGHLDPIGDVIVTPDGKRAIAIDSGGIIKVWDLGTTQELLTIRVRSDYRGTNVKSITGRLVMDPASKRLALVQVDGNVKLWFGRFLGNSP